MAPGRSARTLAQALVPVLAIVALAAATTPARANEMQRIILDAGINLGLWQAQVAIFDTPATDPAQIGYATNVVMAVEMVRERLAPPFADLDLVAVVEAVERYPQQTDGRPGFQRASAVDQIRTLFRTRLSLLYLSTVGIYAAPNCDSAFLDVGYHLGRAQMAAFAGDGTMLSGARSDLLQAVRSGLAAARDTGCGFNLETVWNGLGIDRAQTLADFQALIDPIRMTAEVASARFDLADPWAPSDPERETPPPPDQPDTEIVGTWRYETGVHVVFRAAGGWIVGTSHGFSSTLLGIGYVEGMESHRLQATAAGTYHGQAAVRQSDGTFVWKDVRVIVRGDVAEFSDLYDGGPARYQAVRER